MSESLGISQPPDKFRRPHVVIIGGGFAGIAAVKALRHCEADVTVIDRRTHHIFQPLLYQVAKAALGPADVSPPIRQQSAGQKTCPCCWRKSSASTWLPDPLKSSIRALETRN